MCNEGLVQIVPFRGYTITPLTIEEYRNLYEVQSILDPMIAGLAAERANPDQIKEMEYWASYEYHPGQKNSYYTFLEWNKHFHIAIAEATGNSALVVTEGSTGGPTFPRRAWETPFSSVMKVSSTLPW